MSKKLIAGIGTAAALGIAALPVLGAFAIDSTTYVRVTVGQGVNCQSSNNAASTAVDLGTKVPGESGTATFTVTGSTNATTGFTVTGTPTDLIKGTLSGETFTADSVDPASIAYSATGSANGKWWVGTTESEGVTIGSTIALTKASAVEYTFNLSANVIIANTQAQGLYQGQIDWVCVAN